MDAVSYSLASKQAQRIKKFINEPDSTSGIVTVPKTIASGETVTIPSGRVAILPNVQIDGVLNVEGEVFIPSGATLSSVVEKVTSTDNAVVRFDGTTGQVQNSGVTIDDAGNVGIGTSSPSFGLHVKKSGISTQALVESDTAASVIQFKNASSGTYPPQIGSVNDAIMLQTAGGERMRIDSAGRVTMPYQPAFCVAGLSGTYAGPCTFPFSSFVLGVPSQKSINFNTSNGAFTAPISGLYQFNFNIYNFNANDVTYAVFKNGSGLVSGDWFQRMSGSVPMTTWSFALYLNSNDYIQMGLRNGTVNVYSGHTYFSGYLIS